MEKPTLEQHGLDDVPKLEDYGLYRELYKQYKLDYKNLNNKLSVDVTHPLDSIIGFFGGLCVLSFFLSLYYADESGVYSFLVISIIVGLILFWVGSLVEKNKNEKKNVLGSEIERQIKVIRFKVGRYEKATKTYFQEHLEWYFNEYLFRKHTHTDKYKESLIEMVSLINIAKKVNEEMLFERVYYSKFENYIKEKEKEIGFRAEFKNLLNNTHVGEKPRLLKQVAIQADQLVVEKEIVGMKDFVPVKEKQDISKQINNQNKTPTIEDVEVEITPKEPQTPFGRKIDWDEVNKHRRELGNKGEEIVYALEKSYLHAISREDLAEQVKHASKDIGDGLGYDILSYDDKGVEKYIEVKSTSREKSDSFNISKNELNFLKSNKDKAHIYRVLNVDSDDHEPFVETYTADEILSSQIEPTQFRININK